MQPFFPPHRSLSNNGPDGMAEATDFKTPVKQIRGEKMQKAKGAIYPFNV